MVAHLLDHCGLTPGFLLGGVAKNFSAGYRLPQQQNAPFVIEGDEYDTVFFDKGPHFHYRPSICLLNNIDPIMPIFTTVSRKSKRTLVD